MSRIIKQNLGEVLIPLEIQKELDAFRSIECAENPNLPRKQKLAIPLEATPNLAFSLYVMQPKINQKPNDVLVILDYCNMLIRLKLLPDRMARTAFNAFYSSWVAIFDSPTYVIVHRGSNLSVKLINERLHQFESQLLPIPAKAPWDIGLNEQQHRYLYKSVDLLLLQQHCDTCHDHEFFRADKEMGWNFAPRTNNTIPHYHRFGLMPRIIGALDESPLLNECIALIHMAYE